MMTRFMPWKGAMPAALAASAPRGPSAPSQLRGVLLLVGSTTFFSVSDVITKQLTATLPPGEVAWMRFVVLMLLVIPALAMNGGGALLRSRRPALQILRGLGMVGSTIAFTHSLRYLPVADATAINFVSPILIMALSVLFLGETVGWRRWSAAAVGFLGVVLIIRPGTGAFQTAAFLPLLAAASWAGAAVATRKMSGSDHALTTLAYSAFVGFLVLSAALPFEWETPGRNRSRARHRHSLEHRPLVRHSGLPAWRCVDPRTVLLHSADLDRRARLLGLRVVARCLDDPRRRHHCGQRALHRLPGAHPRLAASVCRNSGCLKGERPVGISFANARRAGAGERRGCRS
jgi:threonine/homoserine efflux transporter RhtA